MTKKVILYICSVILGCFYLTVLWWGKNPDVGTEYEMYYLTHELSDWPGYGNLKYDYGTVEFCTGLKDRNGVDNPYKVCQRKGQGFLKEQYEGSKTVSDSSYIYYIPVTDTDEGELVVDITDYEGEKATVVYYNDVEIGSFDSPGVYSFHMGRIEADKLVTIHFETKESDCIIWSVAVNG